MALQRIERDGIQDDAINAAKIEDGTVAGQDIADGTITNTQIHASAAIATAKISGLGTAATLAHGTSANQVVRLDSNAKIPAVNASLLTGLNAANITPGGTLPAISGVNLIGVATDTSTMENNIAILAFKVQAANDLVKFNLIDQVVDEFEDNSGIDASASTNETLTSGYYKSSAAGGTTDSVSWTQNFVYGTQAGSWQNMSLRTRIKSSLLTHAGTADAIRITVQSANNEGCDMDKVFIGQWVAGGDGVNVTATPTIIQKGGADAWAIGQNQNWVSDWTTFPLNTANDYVIGFDFANSTSDGLHRRMDFDNGHVWYKSNTDSYNATTVSGWQSNSTTVTGIRVIEVRIAGADVYNPLTLQSNATTAESAPTTGDIVMLITDNGGTPAVINTDIKAYISRNGSAFTSAVTLVDKGNWGTNKRILVANNVDLSGITTGTSMKYKIETLNQTSSKYTYIDAVSLAWA